MADQQPSLFPLISHLIIEDIKKHTAVRQQDVADPEVPFSEPNPIISAYNSTIDLLILLRRRIYEETGR